MTPHLEVLRKGDDWKLPLQLPQHILISTEKSSFSQRAKDRFRQLVKEHGSAAIWLSESGYLVTDNPNEAAKNFPYEEWLDQALKEAGQT